MWKKFSAFTTLDFVFKEKGVYLKYDFASKLAGKRIDPVQVR